MTQPPDELVERLRAPWFTNGCAQYQREAADRIEADAATITALRQRVAELEAENKRLISAWEKKHEQFVAEKQEAALWFTKAQEWKAAVLAEREACARWVARHGMGDDIANSETADGIRNRSNDHEF